MIENAGAFAVPTTEDEELDVSVVLPVYNEQGHLLAEIDRIRAALDASEYSYEIIVVDDGSDDGSSEQLNDLPDIRLIRFRQNRGSGSARKAGSNAARGRVVVWTDADMTYPNDRIPELVGELDGYDQVVGARTSEQGTVKVARVPAKWFIRKLASYLVETDIPDLNSGLRAFRADVGRQYLHLLPPGFSCVTTLTLAFLANGYSVKYVPIEYAERAGRSKFHWWRDTKRYLIQVIRMILSYNPLRVFLPLALILATAGLVKLGYDWAERDFRLAANTLLILFAAFQFLAIGLLADLVVRLSKPRSEVDPASL
ncbi:MAG: glycosyltransferase family 2 protein [Acidimicrobiia bacterium]